MHYLEIIVVILLLTLFSMVLVASVNLTWQYEVRGCDTLITLETLDVIVVILLFYVMQYYFIDIY